jgi:RHS repeat-associated protein
VTRAPENVAARQTDYIRDDYGNAITVIEKEFTGEADRQTDTIYDNNGIYPQTITNSKGQDTEVVGGLYQRVVNSGTTDTVEERFALNAAGRKLGEIVREHGGADTTLYFHADHQGSIDTITMDGQVSAKQEFDPFGKPIDALAEPLTRAGFTGHAHDNDLGLVDMKGRIYHPFAARFTTPNPVMQSTYSTQGLNRYNYVFNNPVNNVDPNGRETFVDTIYGFSGKRRLFGYVQSGDHRRFARLVDEPAPDLPEYSVVDATETYRGMNTERAPLQRKRPGGSFERSENGLRSLAR